LPTIAAADALDGSIRNSDELLPSGGGPNEKLLSVFLHSFLEDVVKIELAAATVK